MNDIKKMIEQYYQIYFAIGDAYERIAKRIGMTSSNLFVLYIIYTNPEECTAKLICDKLLFPKQTVNTILTSFEQQGYLYKETSCIDKRNKNIFFTKKGREYAKNMMAFMDYFDNTAFAGMSEEERAALLIGERAFLRQMTVLADDFEKQGGFDYNVPQ